METHKLFPGKYFISSILEMLEYKSEMTGQTKRRYLMRAAMAGVIVGLLYIGNYTIQTGMRGASSSAWTRGSCPSASCWARPSSASPWCSSTSRSPSC